MSIEQDLLSLKTKSEKLNTLKIETATKLTSLEEEKARLLAECQVLGVDPAGIEQAVKDAEAQLQQEVATLTEQVNTVFDGLNKI